MAELPPNPDQVLFPQHAPELILSVERSFAPTALTHRMDIYAETVELTRDLVVKNEIDDSEAPDGKKPDKPKNAYRLGLFANSIHTVLPEGRQLLQIDFSGADGTESDTRGHDGGNISCYVQRLDQKSIDTLNIDANGGHGYDQLLDPSPGKKPSPGGDGGNGGSVHFVFGTHTTGPLFLARQVFTEVHSGVRKYPNEVKDAVKALMTRCKDSRVQAIRGMTDILETLAKFPRFSKAEFEMALTDLIVVLESVESNVQAQIPQSIGVDGGFRGAGNQGLSDNGKAGIDGSTTVVRASNPKALWDVDMCFAHPTQCHMMLERAKARYYAGIPTPSKEADKRKTAPLGEALAVLETLTDRLMFLDPKHQPKVMSSTTLFKAYKRADATLNIPDAGNGGSDMPASLSQLISIRTEALSLLASIDAGVDAFGDQLNSVPTGSFSFYHGHLINSLAYLAEAERKYQIYKKAADKSAENKEHIENSKRATEAAVSYNNSMIRDIYHELNDSAANLERFSYPLAQAKTKLIAAAKAVESELKKVISIPYDELVSAGAQIMFVPKWPMMALQGLSIYHQTTSKIIEDDGRAVDRKYLVRRVHNITGSLQSLQQGYEMLSDGSLVDNDDASKLLMEESEFSKLMDEVYSSLKEKTVEGVKSAFKFYISLVIERSHEIIRYNALVSTLARYKTENQTLNHTSEELQRADVASTSVRLPIIVVFMQKLYVKAIRKTEYWLYKAQRAYNYAALNYENIIGDSLGVDTPFSRYDSTLLSNAEDELSTAYAKYLERRGPARGMFKKLQVPLDEWEHIPRIKACGAESCTLLVKVSPTSLATTLLSPETKDNNTSISINPSNPFAGMANVRLLRARCYLQGATCTPSNTLHLTLTHSGIEVLIDHTARDYEFKHKSQIVSTFKYHLETGEIVLDSTIGNNREKSGYALVGPFVTWRLDINKDYNEGMDLSGVSDGYLEFEGYFQSVI
ncbi:hypothetical protein NW762_003080 [Fusarium torreyae]|uniref:Uncharacterized protein n=1 Tax=Fusarium torreyae TaxID=1237075 RepID=A0A9W8SB20_9HYPO|nr:hypothetical protein NW762_003080 [Fusarium torreyae]